MLGGSLAAPGALRGSLPCCAVEIRSTTVLPARRTDVELVTADGQTLVGELAVPQDREPAATAICLHPLPTEGGSMDSHVLRKASARLPALAGIAVLRFNTRGTTSERGTSTGTFDAGGAERHDVAAAIAWAAAAGLPHRWLVGWSFGTDLALTHGLDPSIEGAVLLSPPLRWSPPSALEAWAASGLPVRALVPELDDFLRPPAARERFAPLTQAEVVAVEGGKHLWVGERLVRRALDEIAQTLVPGSAPLAREWPDG